MNYLSANVRNLKKRYLIISREINSLIPKPGFKLFFRRTIYDRAISNDPGFALAYAKRSIARSWGLHTGQLDKSHIDKCKADADKAFELDRDLADAQVALQFYYYYCTEDYPESY